MLDAEDIQILSESANWRSRDVAYIGGSWEAIQKKIPTFELGDFLSEPDSPPNPYYRAVYRLPMTPMERRMPVGIVSNSYTLAQHSEVARLCVKGLENCGFDAEKLECQLGLSTLGEWMNFRAFLPEEFDLVPQDQRRMRLRLECFNSVDGSCCLELFLGWYRLICSNGLVIGESLRRVKEIHDSKLDISVLKRMVADALETVSGDRVKMKGWSQTSIEDSRLAGWIDGPVSDAWGKLAAFRVLHICRTGHDAEFADPFEKCAPSEKRPKRLEPVPGAAMPAANLYDVSQSLSWVATQRRNADQRSEWQRAIPNLMQSLVS